MLPEGGRAESADWLGIAFEAEGPALHGVVAVGNSTADGGSVTAASEAGGGGWAGPDSVVEDVADGPAEGAETGGEMVLDDVPLASRLCLASASRFSSRVSKAGHVFSAKSRKAFPSCVVVTSKTSSERSVCC